MSFELQNVVPWGRNLDEYIRMFGLTQADIDNPIISFGDGPASFNYELTKRKRQVVSIDPIYDFTKEQLRERMEQTRSTIMEQVRANLDQFVWGSTIKNPDELERIRINAMTLFLNDFEKGKKENRYLAHDLPNRTQFTDHTFHLGLSSHFLLLYPQLGIDFHIESLKEMLRVCKEVRVFPLLNLNSERSEVLDGIISNFDSVYKVDIIKVSYEFQRGGDRMLVIKHNSL